MNRERRLQEQDRSARQREQQLGEAPWSDGTFAYIAGYTGWGFPYGITWEEMDRLADQESLYATIPHESYEA
ncbi:hypothetical protein [Paenibacillus medicaginis]|uniref:Uncharacterized protein n=1 Tax=Paenibacillus medicaginis TaxID=1470560 RepID=A0ABV5C3G7_9BACL